MLRKTLIALALWAAALAAPALSQQAPATGDSPAALEQSAGAVAIGQPYTRETFGDWDMRCIRTETGQDPCQLYQLMKDDQGNPVAEISLFPFPPGQPAAAGATIATPLETLLTEQVTIRVDDGKTLAYPFTYCTIQGCFARIGLTEEDVTAYKQGKVARVRIVPLAAPDSEVVLEMSLKGFTEAFDAVTAWNAENVPPVQQ